MKQKHSLLQATNTTREYTVSVLTPKTPLVFRFKTKSDCITHLYNYLSIKFNKSTQLWESNNPEISIGVEFQKFRKDKLWECRVFIYHNSVLEKEDLKIVQYPRHFKIVPIEYFKPYYTIAFKFFSKSNNLELVDKRYIMKDLTPMNLEQAATMASKQMKHETAQYYRICVPHLIKSCKDL